MLYLSAKVKKVHFLGFSQFVATNMTYQRCNDCLLNVYPMRHIHSFFYFTASLIGETGAHWDKNQSSGPGPKNVNLTTSDT